MEFIVDMLLFYSDSKYFTSIFNFFLVIFSFNCFFLFLFLFLTYVLLL